jgi:hypothetical protein
MAMYRARVKISYRTVIKGQILLGSRLELGLEIDMG